MAEALLRTRLDEVAGRPTTVTSAGTDVRTPGGAATTMAIEVLAEQGIDLADHLTRPLDAGLLADADLVVAMTRRHEAVVGAVDPVARTRTFLVGEVVRLAATVGSRGDRPIAEWVRALDSSRGGHFTSGRVADEVADPWGGTAGDYRRCADRLDGVCAALARFLAGA